MENDVKQAGPSAGLVSKTDCYCFIEKFHLWHWASRDGSPTPNFLNNLHEYHRMEETRLRPELSCVTWGQAGYLRTFSVISSVILRRRTFCLVSCSFPDWRLVGVDIVPSPSWHDKDSANTNNTDWKPSTPTNKYQSCFFPPCQPPSCKGELIFHSGPVSCLLSAQVLENLLLRKMSQVCTSTSMWGLSGIFVAISCQYTTWQETLSCEDCDTCSQHRNHAGMTTTGRGKRSHKIYY